MGHNHTTRSQKLFDVTVAEVEAVIEPYGVSDNFLRKPKPFVGWSNSVYFHAESMTQVVASFAEEQELDNAACHALTSAVTPAVFVVSASIIA
jgi:hypothetical protein